MSKNPDCPRCKNLLVIPDAPTWPEFLKQAGLLYRAKHPQSKKAGKRRGHPLNPNSPLAKLAIDLVRNEAANLTALTVGRGALPAAVIDRWASSPDTANDLTEKLEAKIERQDSNYEHTEIRRAIKLALLDEKSWTSLTDKDIKLLSRRQRTTLRLLNDATPVFTSYMARLRALLGKKTSPVKSN